MIDDLQTLKIESEAGVATLTLDDSRRRNAISLPMVEEIGRVFDHLESSSDIGAVVITFVCYALVV